MLINSLSEFLTHILHVIFNYDFQQFWARRSRIREWKQCSSHLKNLLQHLISPCRKHGLSHKQNIRTTPLEKFIILRRGDFYNAYTHTSPDACAYVGFDKIALMNNESPAGVCTPPRSRIFSFQLLLIANNSFTLPRLDELVVLWPSEYTLLEKLVKNN